MKVADRDLTFILPAYREDNVADVVRELREEFPESRVLVVDDGSGDGTAERAGEAGAEVLRHPYNKGNGAAVKTGLRAAQTEFVVLLDADGQHPPGTVRKLVGCLAEYDLVVGARDATAEVHWWRSVANRVYNRLASYLAGMEIPDLTSGFRAARRKRMMEFVHLFPNGFSYPTTSTLSFIRAGYDVTFVPIPMRFRRAGRSKIRLFRDGSRFLLIILRMITLHNPLRVFAPVSLGLALLGTVYGLWSFSVTGKLPNGALAAWMTAIFIFAIGLVSEQINALRFEKRD